MSEIKEGGPAETGVSTVESQETVGTQSTAPTTMTTSPEPTEKMYRAPDEGQTVPVPRSALRKSPAEKSKSVSFVETLSHPVDSAGSARSVGPEPKETELASPRESEEETEERTELEAFEDALRRGGLAEQEPFGSDALDLSGPAGPAKAQRQRAQRTDQSSQWGGFYAREEEDPAELERLARTKAIGTRNVFLRPSAKPGQPAQTAATATGSPEKHPSPEKNSA